MMRNLTLTVVFFIMVLSIPYIVDAGVLVEKTYQENQQIWIDPNNNVNAFQKYYTAQNGLTCKNQVLQVIHKGLYIPARKCQLPDGSWHYFSF